MLAVALTASDVGGAEDRVTTIGELTIVSPTVAVCDGSLVTLAVIVTVLSTGTSEGAV
jgi:hypothetical protein